MWTDIGMPKGQTRDSTWNTNNWVERAWRVFDQVFLNYRKNKRCVNDLLLRSADPNLLSRLDRLAMIIIFEFFPYYAYWREHGGAKLPIRMIRASLAGHRLWDQGFVEHLGKRRYRVHHNPKAVSTENDDLELDDDEDAPKDEM